MPGSDHKISIFPLLSVNFIATLGYSIMLPFLVYLVHDFRGNAFLYGALGAFYSVFQMIGSPILGRLSDYYGRKKMLFICEAGTFISWGIFFLALVIPVKTLFTIKSGLLGDMEFTTPLIIVFIARAVDGITAGDISIANAYLADITGENELKKNYGQMASSANMGFILGPLLAGVLGATALGLKLPVMAASLISLVALLLIVFGLPESHKRNNTSAADKEAAGPKPTFAYLVRRPNVGYMLMLYFLIYLGFNFFYTSFPLYASEILKWDVKRLGIFFAVLSGEMVLVQGPLLSLVSKRFSDEFLTIAGGIILSMNFLLMMSHQMTVLYIAAFLFSLGNGIMWPSFLAILSRVAGSRYQGAIQGIAGSAGSLASIIGLVLGGILYHTYHEQVFIITAVVIFVVFILSFWLPKKVVVSLES